ncbi:MAG: hypothetical protein EBY98_06155, partial [Acidimicrobiia bacterium]|nr:hypothetical protein [Acidimicrobiia bacterium]
CYALLPYSNRIGHCRFDWLGSAYTTRQNFGDHPHSLHGVGWQRSWEVLAADESAITLGLTHVPDADWPTVSRRSSSPLLKLVRASSCSPSRLPAACSGSTRCYSNRFRPISVAPAALRPLGKHG